MPTARAKTDEVRQLVVEGVSKSEIARRLGIHRASVHRILAATTRCGSLGYVATGAGASFSNLSATSIEESCDGR
jgi:DNA invertase Pin-like site-specific DNA recombinase